MCLLGKIRRLAAWLAVLAKSSPAVGAGEAAVALIRDKITDKIAPAVIGQSLHSRPELAPVLRLRQCWRCHGFHALARSAASVNALRTKLASGRPSRSAQTLSRLMSDAAMRSAR